MRCLLIDKIIAFEKGQRITGIKNVTMSENFLQDHFPGFPVMPGVLQLEAVLQLASWLVFATTDFMHKVRLESLKSIKFKEFIVPGDQMHIDLESTARDASTMTANARIAVQGKLKTDIKQMTFSFVPVDEREDPLKAKAHYDFITGGSPLGSYTYKKSSIL